jgi:hypothetical protein
MSDFDNAKEDSAPDDFNKRLVEHTRLLEDFAKNYKREFGVSIEYTENAAFELTVYYYRVLMRDVWPYVPKRVNRYKIASILELVIMDLQPIHFEEPIRRRRLNSFIAYYAAIGAIASFTPSGSIAIPQDPYVNGVLAAVKKQHLQWLYGKKRTDFPIFSNASFLTLLHLISGHAFPSPN